MSSIAIITARGGSKRIPQKNIKKFCGKPIIAYSIYAALNSGLFDEVMVSTDDEGIAAIAKSYGASVPFFRSSKNADDYATTADVIQEVLIQYKELGRQFDTLCCIYPTAPFITAKKLKESMYKLETYHADAVIPVVEYSFPPQRCFVIEEGKLQYKWPENRLVRSQDLEKYYHDCGQFYMLKTKAFLEEKSMVLKNTVPFIMDAMEVQDIDTLTDWKLAEEKYHLFQTQELSLKEATLEDCRFLYELRNSPDVRKNSFQTGEIDYSDHESWFQNKLQSDSSFIWILTANSQKVGQVRVDFTDKKGEISYAISKHMRGKGYAVWMLQEMEKRVAQKYKNIVLCAKVKEENIVSCHIFYKLQYQSKKTGDEYLFWKETEGKK